MPNVALPGVVVMLSDWRGHCVWVNSKAAGIKVGELAWSNLSARSQEDAKTTMSRVVALREREQVEVVDRQKRLFRFWLFPLDSPDVAVCSLGILVPSSLRLLTKREREVLGLIGSGIETRAIASQLDVSVSTVHTHMRRSREKLGLAGVEALIAFAGRHCYPITLPLERIEPSTEQSA